MLIDKENDLKEICEGLSFNLLKQYYSKDNNLEFIIKASEDGRYSEYYIYAEKRSLPLLHVVNQRNIPRPRGAANINFVKDMIINSLKEYKKTVPQYGDIINEHNLTFDKFNSFI